MVTFKNKLDEMLADAVLATSTQRFSKIAAVRTYISNTPPNIVRTQIAEITSIPELRMLQAAGVPQDLQDIFLFVYNRLVNAGVGT